MSTGGASVRLSSTVKSSSSSGDEEPIALPPPSASRTTISLVHLNLALYAFFWWLNQPVLPFLSKELGADNVIFGYFQSFNQLAQMVGAPLIGRLIDVRGAKTALLVSHAAACVSYLLLWRADSIFLLFASQVPSVLMAAMHSSQAYITLVSRWEDRAAQLGRVALSYGVGFLFGPMVGGTLSKYIGYHAIALIGCVGSACVCVAMAVLLPAVAPVARVPQEESEDPEPSATSTFTSTKGWLTAAHLLASPSIRAMVLIKFFLATALAIYRTSFTLYAKDHFGLDAQHHGFILSGVGVLICLVNLFGISLLTSLFSERTIVTRSVCVMASMLALSAFGSFSLPVLLVCLMPMTASGVVAATLLTSGLTRIARDDDAGSVLGLDMSIGTASRIFAPTIGGWLLLAGYQTMAGVTASLALVAVFLAKRNTDAWTPTSLAAVDAIADASFMPVPPPPPAPAPAAAAISTAVDSAATGSELRPLKNKTL